MMVSSLLSQPRLLPCMCIEYLNRSLTQYECGYSFEINVVFYLHYLHLTFKLFRPRINILDLFNIYFERHFILRGTYFRYKEKI